MKLHHMCIIISFQLHSLCACMCVCVCVCVHACVSAYMCVHVYGLWWVYVSVVCEKYNVLSIFFLRFHVKYKHFC